ncbi:MAG TPA: hydantoinase B/oxoprolinase family protein [Planctomycetes bacterium]|nr:hydantoinase B/oxoprolinase family protein [Planctomycetota bacterium]
MSRADRARGADLLRLDVFQHLFAGVAEEMGASLQRSSFSPNIRERRDYSCALFDGEGRMIGQASHLPVHLGSTPMSVAAAIERVEMGPGDAVLLNDPYAGGTHLPDLTLVSPVFLGRDRRPTFFCANRAHHADVGGAEPGSMAGAKDIHGEGVRIPPMHLARGGRIERELVELLLANMRATREREGDLLAQWSTNQLGVRRLTALAEEYGKGELVGRARELIDWTERLTRELLRSLPDGCWQFEDELEGPKGDRPKIRLRLEKRGEAITFDFRGTDRRPGSARNTVRAVTVSAVFYVLRLFLPAGTPTNAGILRPVTILTEPGTLVDAVYPSGVAAGNVETSQRLVDVLLGAFGKGLVPDAPAASAGTMSNLTFGGLDASGGTFAYYETIGGGAGAGRGRPGAHGIQTHMTNTRNTPIEELELSYPVRVLASTLRRGSGGAGESPGGDGIRKRLRFLAPVQVSFTAERMRRGPWGARGGGAGQPGGFRYRLRGARWKRLGDGVVLALGEGAEIEVRTPGGGGFGRPGRGEEG